MLQSMTGYGDACIERAGVSVFVEVRTVNNRYLKVGLRSNEPLGAMELPIEEEVRHYISRGSVQVTVRMLAKKSMDSYQVNTALLSSYRKQWEDWMRSEGLPLPTEWSTSSWLSLPGVIVEAQPEEDTSDQWLHLRDTLRLALEKLVAMRKQEGEAMVADLRLHLAEIATRLQNVEEQAPRTVQMFTERLVEKLNRLYQQERVEVSPSDLIREMGIFADRCDISEEVSRLKSHLNQFEMILSQEETPGKKLDFLTQELFRETNTIGSKANDVLISQEVIGMKASIERIREQVQNIE